MHYTVWATQISITTKKSKDILKGMKEIPNFVVLPWVLFNIDSWVKKLRYVLTELKRGKNNYFRINLIT